MDRKHIIHQDRAPITVTRTIEEDCRLCHVQVNSILTSTVVRDGVSLEQKIYTQEDDINFQVDFVYPSYRRTEIKPTHNG